MKKLVKVLMMMALVFGAASCSDEKDMPVMPTTPETEQENTTKTEEPKIPHIIKLLTKSIEGHDNISLIDNTTMMRDSIDGCGVMVFDMSSFEGLKTVIYIDDFNFHYDIYVPSEGTKINLKHGLDIFFNLPDNMYKNKERIKVPFTKELLGFRCDCDEERHKHGEYILDYYYKAYNDYVVGIFDSPQVLQLEILPNQSGEEQILSFGVDDGLPLCGAGINIIQAAK